MQSILARNEATARADAAEAHARLAFDTTPEGEKLRRYGLSAARLVNQTIKTYLSVVRCPLPVEETVNGDGHIPGDSQDVRTGVELRASCAPVGAPLISPDEVADERSGDGRCNSDDGDRRAISLTEAAVDSPAVDGPLSVATDGQDAVPVSTAWRGSADALRTPAPDRPSIPPAESRADEISSRQIAHFAGIPMLPRPARNRLFPMRVWNQLRFGIQFAVAGSRRHRFQYRQAGNRNRRIPDITSLLPWATSAFWFVAAPSSDLETGKRERCGLWLGAARHEVSWT